MPGESPGIYFYYQMGLLFPNKKKSTTIRTEFSPSKTCYL